MNKLARHLQQGDEVKLGHRWRRVTRVEHISPATDETIDLLVERVSESHRRIDLDSRSYEQFAEDVAELNSAAQFRLKHPGPVVRVVAASGVTTHFDQLWKPDSLFEVRQ